MFLQKCPQGCPCLTKTWAIMLDRKDMCIHLQHKTIWKNKKTVKRISSLSLFFVSVLASSTWFHFWGFDPVLCSSFLGWSMDLSRYHPWFNHEAFPHRCGKLGLIIALDEPYKNCCLQKVANVKKSRISQHDVPTTWRSWCNQPCITRLVFLWQWQWGHPSPPRHLTRRKLVILGMIPSRHWGDNTEREVIFCTAKNWRLEPEKGPLEKETTHLHTTNFWVPC